MNLGLNDVGVWQWGSHGGVGGHGGIWWYWWYLVVVMVVVVPALRVMAVSLTQEELHWVNQSLKPTAAVF